MKALKLVVGNVLITLVLLIVVNLSSKMVIDYHSIIFNGVSHILAGMETGAVVRDALSPNWMMNPNYTDEARATAIFDELDQLQTEYQPFIGWTRLPFRGTAITIGESGDRLHPHTANAPDTTMIARFFGGSTMWGTGADDAHTIAALFEASNPMYRTYNHGESGFNSRQSLARLINLYNQGETADLVVFYDGVNDVFSLCRENASPNSHLRERLIRDRLRRSVLATASFDVFVRHTVRLASIVTRKLGAAQGSAYDCATNAAKAKRVAQTLVNNWRIAYTITNAYGGEFLGVLQPVAYIGTPRIEHLRNNLRALGGLREQFDVVYPLVRRLMRKYDYMYDFTEIFDTEEIAYVDFCHVSPNGNRRIADRLSEVANGDG